MNHPRATEAAESSALHATDTMFALLRAAHALEDRLERALDSVQLSMAKFSVLSALAEAGRPQPLGDLALTLSCVRSNITQLVDRMEADGLVRRVSDPSDRRIVLAELTTLGGERRAAGAIQIETVRSRFAESLSGDDRAALERAMKQLC
jgi:DNA-binding MarR family transcriptional regulator